MNNKLKLNAADFETNNKAELFEKIVEDIYDREIDYNNLDGFIKPIRNLIHVFDMHSQVMNGGLIQFVDNSTGDFFEETLIGLKEINANECVELLERLRDKYPNKTIPKNWEERRNAFDKISENLTQVEEWELDDFFENLDKEYYDYETQFQLMVIQYVQKYIDE